jgi:hypothetical protein
VTLGASNAVLPGTPPGITIAAWVRGNNTEITGHRRVFTLRKASGSALALAVGKTAYTASLAYRNTSDVLSYVASPTFAVDTPHFVAVTCGKGVAKAYADGVLGATVTDFSDTNSFGVTSANAYILSTDGSSDTWRGYLWMCLVFTKVLGLKEIQDLQRDTQSLFGVHEYTIAKAQAAPTPGGNSNMCGQPAVVAPWGYGYG